MLNEFTHAVRVIDPGDYFKSSSYRVTLTHKDGARFETPYSMGPGHRVWKQGARRMCPYEHWSLKDGECVCHRYPNLKDCEQNRLVLEWFAKWTYTPDPSLGDVLGALVMDAFSVNSGESFDDWCESIGYDTDSRKAERMYRACLDTSQWFRRCGVDVGTMYQELEEGGYV